MLCVSISLSAQSYVADSVLLDAYLRNDMSVWKKYIDSYPPSAVGRQEELRIEYGYCGYIVAEAKKEGQEALLPEAKRYVQLFKSNISHLKSQLPVGHYEMYMSAAYVYELRLHESFHPAKSLSLAREAVRLAPDDPMTLMYCATALFYAPKPFGSKKEALELFLRAEQRFVTPQWYNCWWRAAAMMYIAQCYDKQGNTEEVIRRTRVALAEYPGYLYLRETYLPELEAK